MDVGQIDQLDPVRFALDGTTTLIVETTEDFLRRFGITNFYNVEVFDRLRAATSTLPITQGGFGAVYPFPAGTAARDARFVVKKTEICTGRDPNGARKTMADFLCKFAKEGDFVYRFPNTDNDKLTVWAPNYLTEGIIGVLLSSLHKYTPGFMRVYNMQYIPMTSVILAPKPVTYILTEKLADINYSPPYQNFIYQLFFQIAHALNIGQMLYKFTHYDLHRGNIMMRPLNTPMTYIYELENGKYFALQVPNEYVIIDYGLNRIETHDTILSGRTLYQGYELQGRDPTNPGVELPWTPDILAYGEFNPYIDLVELLYDLFLAYERNGSSTVSIVNLLKLALNVSDDTSKDELIEIFNNHLRVAGNWRLRPERLAMSYTYRGGTRRFRNCRNPSQFMSALAEKYYSGYTFKSLPNIPNSKIFYLPPVSERLSTKYLNYARADMYNATPTREVLNPNIPFSVLNGQNTNPTTRDVVQYHIARIDVKSGFQQGYKFNLDCCRLDSRTFMQSSSKNGCIAVNASYFNINDDYRPVGVFRTDKFESNNPIPVRYEQFYGLVAIKNGSLIIDKDLSNSGAYSACFTSGPMLIWPGEDGTRRRLTQEYVLHHAPALTGSGSGPPGQLTHVANRNPRMALAVDTVNNMIYFIYVEGRSTRSTGLTCVELTDLIEKLPNITHAINLDGGRSAQMTWRAPGTNTISIAGTDTQNNTDRATAYPVGNILSFCRQ